jgi:6-pyruvoyltetrahydropterin/6-carboxytetrahydropterin synthase
VSYRSTKTYGHDVGLSCAFRQWRADSHCAKLHGYALSVSLEFSASILDKRGWVVDFGALKPVKQFLQDTFDHKTVLAPDDPLLVMLQSSDWPFEDAFDLVVLEHGVGCEKFAKHIFDWVTMWVNGEYPEGRVRLESVEVREHGANSAIYRRD